MASLEKPGQAPQPLRDIIASAVSRRSFIHALAGSTAVAALSEWPKVLGSERSDIRTEELFCFRGIPPSSSDTVVVPDGYVAEVLYRWGDPIDGQSPVFLKDASNSAADQERQAGMGHDGMEYFAIPGQDPNRRGLLAVNHEYTDQILLFRDGLAPLPPEPMPKEKVRKSMASHGVSIVEIERSEKGNWSVVPSKRARRITAYTPVRISGPATSKIGTSALGTVNNCAAGRTPWQTYLTCEENFQGIFGTNDVAFQPSASQKAYGLDRYGFFYKIDGNKVPGYRWWEQEPRFDLSRPDNDSERFGYVVEIDPMDPNSVPVKRTALGRFRHENAELTIAPNGRVAVYMGDDEMDQFVYKFVSEGKYDPNGTQGQGVRLGDGIFDRGKLYVARFDADGSGVWLELAPGRNNIPAKQSAGDSQGFDAADICIRTREAAKMAGATPMDRPEWISIHPTSREVYVSLTNNKSRHAADAANPRANNVYGHIVRWEEDNNDPTAERFRWQVFLFGGNPTHEDPAYRSNAQGDFFACPDGLKFDPSGILWIQTDMSSSVMGKPGFVEIGHNMMLAADPATGATRRFLTGPRGCEITGMAMTPDRKTMFVNIQHPGEPADDLNDPAEPMKVSQWPDGPDGGRPRSATVVIRKLDGGTIGS
ncbi:MAG: PhoX family protein [Planctomycetota bacterium]|jgi:secreted PhoX family phosphatase